MSSENEIKPGMLVLWTGGRGGLPRPTKTFLGFVVAELPPMLCLDSGGTRKLLVFVCCSDTGQNKTVIPIFEHHMVPFSKEK